MVKNVGNSFWILALIAAGSFGELWAGDHGQDAPRTLDKATVAQFAELALRCVHQEYPNKIAHVLLSDEDVLPPRALTPAFCGCFDWHSSVHGHWLLVRLLRLFPDASFAPSARAALARSLTPINIRAERDYLAVPDRAPFERPYGLAWLLQLCAELRQWDDADGRVWLAALEPLESLAAERFAEWLPKLSHPIRTGEHSQTAFALGLVLDWARIKGDSNMETLVIKKVRQFHLADCHCPLAYEPSGQDFLSPCLAEADLMRRVLTTPEFAAWLGQFLPQIPLDGSSGWLEPAVVTDPTDGKLAHLAGLNLSRAWMCQGIASALPSGDPRLPALRAVIESHTAAGLEGVATPHYAGGHWLGSFAVYLVTQRGI